jgi:hypothetical protein
MLTDAGLAGRIHRLRCRDRVAGARSGWGLAWAALVLLIGVELLVYME